MRRGVLAKGDIKLLKGLSRPLDFSDNIEPIELYAHVYSSCLFLWYYLLTLNHCVASQSDNKWITAIKIS